MTLVRHVFRVLLAQSHLWIAPNALRAASQIILVKDYRAGHVLQHQCPTSGIQHAYLVWLAPRRRRLAMLAFATRATTTQQTSSSAAMKTHSKRLHHRLLQDVPDVEVASIVKACRKCG
jgi:hypothetical protein